MKTLHNHQWVDEEWIYEYYLCCCGNLIERYNWTEKIGHKNLERSRRCAAWHGRKILGSYRLQLGTLVGGYVQPMNRKKA